MGKIFFLIILFCILWGQNVFGAVTVTPTTGGTNISAAVAVNVIFLPKNMSDNLLLNSPKTDAVKNR
jgi:hypothetical protein